MGSILAVETDDAECGTPLQQGCELPAPQVPVPAPPVQSAVRRQVEPGQSLSCWHPKPTKPPPAHSCRQGSPLLPPVPVHRWKGSACPVQKEQLSIRIPSDAVEESCTMMYVSAAVGA